MIQFIPSRRVIGHDIVAGLTISAITSLDAYALSQGVNDTALTASLAAIAGFGGARRMGRLLK